MSFRAKAHSQTVQLTGLHWSNHLQISFHSPQPLTLSLALSCLHKAHGRKSNTGGGSKGGGGLNMLPLRGGFENKFTSEARREKHKTWCNNDRGKFNSLYHPRGQAQWSQSLKSMKIENCFKICGQVNKIYTAYEVLLVDVKLTLCSFFLIVALCHFFSNPLSLLLLGLLLCLLITLPPAFLRPPLLLYAFVYSPAPYVTADVYPALPFSCSTHRHSTFHRCQPPVYFLPQERHIWAKISRGLAGRGWQGLWHRATGCQQIQNLG